VRRRRNDGFELSHIIFNVWAIYKKVTPGERVGGKSSEKVPRDSTKRRREGNKGTLLDPGTSE
jgi:hypothetical protein